MKISIKKEISKWVLNIIIWYLKKTNSYPIIKIRAKKIILNEGQTFINCEGIAHLDMIIEEPVDVYDKDGKRKISFEFSQSINK